MKACIKREDYKLITIGDPKKIQFQFLDNGGLFRLSYDGIMVNQVLGHPMEGSLNNIYLRIWEGKRLHYIPMMGPASPSQFLHTEKSAYWAGHFLGLDYECILQIHEDCDAWYWQVNLANASASQLTCDLVYVQDLGLAHEAAVRTNEAYCSQYIDHHVFETPLHGYAICSRQNQAADGKHPWILQASLNKTVGYCTDGFSFYGLSYRESNLPWALSQKTLPNQKLQYEFACVVLQSEQIVLDPEQVQEETFFAQVSPDHPEATEAKDLQRIEQLAKELLAHNFVDESPATEVDVCRSLFSTAPLLCGQDLTEQELEEFFPGQRRHEEFKQGELLSFFYDQDCSVALKAKELQVMRPHGHILLSGSALEPRDDRLSLTAYMNGQFNAQMVVGNTSFHKGTSLSRNALNALRASGQRVFLQTANGPLLLGVPSAFEMGRSHCRWIYKTEYGHFVVRSWVSPEDPVCFWDVQVLHDQKLSFLVSYEVLMGEREHDDAPYLQKDDKTGLVRLTPQENSLFAKHYPQGAYEFAALDPQQVESMDQDEPLWQDGQSRNLPFICFRSKPTSSFALMSTGVIEEGQDPHHYVQKYRREAFSFQSHRQQVSDYWQGLLGQRCLQLEGSQDVAKLQDTLQWYVHNAMVHFVSPHGLEQYSGAAWGVRDVCQGPVELLLATQNYSPVRQILCTLFEQQYASSKDWPQWFMFDRYAAIQHAESHGDVIVWPLKALASYLEETEDYGLFDEMLSYRDSKNFQKTDFQKSLYDHMVETVRTIVSRFIDGTALSCYGEGDWDDTLQPANPDMRQNMVSAWTVSLTYQVLNQLALVCHKAGKLEFEAELNGIVQNIQKDFHKHLLKDGVVSGFAYFHGPDSVDLMLHPSDRKTGLTYRLLPMTRSMISQLFTPQEVKDHLALIEKHLTYPDGVRLMDKPAKYRGGVRQFFRRAEEASNVGREISLQYVHAHIRFIEAMCKIGKAEKAYEGILQIVPILNQDQVPNAQLRQSNAYYSSSDPDFADRYEAGESFAKIKSLEVEVKGGWRIYSSGPGIFIRQVLSSFLGLRRSFGFQVIDPVLPKELDGLSLSLEQGGKPLTVQFQVNSSAAQVSRVTVNGTDMPLQFEANPYRPGGAKIALSEFEGALNAKDNQILVQIG